VLAALGAAMAGVAIGLRAQSAVRAIDLAEVRIEEGPTTAAFGDRDITVVFALDRAPSCTAADDGLTYSILIDADMDVATGTRLQATPGLGIDRRISARCNGRTGTFESRGGTVGIALPRDGDRHHTLRIVLRRSGLPSPEFMWVALAHRGTRSLTLPDGQSPAYWAIAEHWLW
jgi:hypothetical protein